MDPHSISCRPEPRRVSKNDPSCYLIFHHVGDSYFLRQVHQSTADVWLPKSRKQKEIVLSFPKVPGRPLERC